MRRVELSLSLPSLAVLGDQRTKTLHLLIAVYRNELRCRCEESSSAVSLLDALSSPEETRRAFADFARSSYSKTSITRREASFKSKEVDEVSESRLKAKAKRRVRKKVSPEVLSSLASLSASHPFAAGLKLNLVIGAKII